MSDLLTTLKFVAHAIDKQSPVSYGEHLSIRNGHVSATNGWFAIDAPINFGIDCSPVADKFISAITNIDEGAKFTILPSNKLKISSGKMKVHVQCADFIAPTTAFFGERIDIDGEKWKSTITKLVPTIATKGAKPWAQSILYRDGCLYSTNNYVMFECAIGVALPEFNIPSRVALAISKIKEVPHQISINTQRVVLHYPNGGKLTFSVLDYTWPNVSGLLACERYDVLPDDFFPSLAKMNKFTDEFATIYVKDGVVSTSDVEDDGISFVVDGLTGVAKFMYDNLRLLPEFVTHINFKSYPKPSHFKGDGVRGLIAGLV